MDMKFLITTSPIASNQSPNRKLLQNARDWIKSKIEEGVVTDAYSTIPRGGIFIMNTPTPETLWDLLLEYPLYQFLNIKVTPLVGYEHVFDRTIQFVESNHSH